MGDGGAAASTPGRGGSVQAIGPPWFTVCGARIAIERLGAIRPRFRPRLAAPRGAEANEAGEVPARVGAAGKIEIARRKLVPLRGNGKFNGLDSDVLEPDELALPEVGRTEIVLELDGLHERGRRRSPRTAGQPLRRAPAEWRRIASTARASKRARLPQPIVLNQRHANYRTHLKEA